MKRNKFFTLIVAITLSACTVFSACKNSEPPTTPPTTPPTSNPPAEVVYVSVNDVVTEALGNFSFSQEYNQVFNTIASQNIDGFQSIKNVSVEQGSNGYKITIQASTTNGDVSYSANGIQGNLAEFLSRGAKTDTQNIADLVAELSYNSGATIVDDSADETAIKEYIAEQIAEFEIAGESILDATFTNDNPTIEPPEQVTYVTAGDVVNQILGDINVDADVQEVADAIVATSAPSSYKIEHILAVDNNIYYLDMKNNSNSKNYIMGLKINNSKAQYQNFYDYVKNKEEAINSILTSKGLNINSQIEENSALHNELISALTSLKTDYNEEKADLSATAKSDISILNIFTPTILSSQEMANLGIDDMNEFSYALLENTRGSGYDKVTGFEKGDIVATYVTTPSHIDIDGYTSFDIVTIAQSGIYKNKIYVAVTEVGQAQKKHLQDSADCSIDENTSILSEFFTKSVVYQNGERFEAQAEVASA